MTRTGAARPCAADAGSRRRLTGAYTSILLYSTVVIVVRAVYVYRCEYASANVQCVYYYNDMHTFVRFRWRRWTDRGRLRARRSERARAAEEAGEDGPEKRLVFARGFGAGERGNGYYS